MRKRWTLLSALLIALTGCTHKKLPDSRTVFRYNEASGVTSLDPAYAKGQADIWACNQLYNGLVQMDDNLKVQPCIASSWTISDDGLTYSFTLRKDVAFHRSPVFADSIGRNVTASDFLYSFGRIADAKVASPGSWVFNAVAPDPETPSGLSFYAPAPDSLVIVLKHPFPPFLGILTSLYCAVVPHEAIDYYGKDFRLHPVGTGPFIFHEWYDRMNLIYWKNPDYFEFDNGTRLP
ncbi:MAG TPA: ABC transporter substrate-binding protein, partial [Bacteroidia bacterium]|nr:ABC transporter substrate-binding protein [Bacteroidia bacterium]